MGRSLGGGVATAMAAQQGARALILVSTFGRLTDVAATHYRWLPVRLLMRNRYDSIARILPAVQFWSTSAPCTPDAMPRELWDTLNPAAKAAMRCQ